MAEIFDFTAFMQNAANPDDETRKDLMREAVAGEMDAVMAEVAPRLWCVMQEQMARDPQNNVYLNAVINASIFALLAWTAACTPQNAEGSDNDQILRDKIMSNLENALENSRGAGAEMSTVAHNTGRLKLTQDALAGVATVLSMNSKALVNIAEVIRQSKG